MRRPYILGEPERAYLTKFFDAVDNAVTAEMQANVSLLEESLTFTLARLLDGSSTFQRMLDYPLGKLNSDLEACGSGHQVSVEFETNEHKKSFESAVSHADLGIVLKWERSPFYPAYTKAIIIQAKKLYVSRGEYRLSSPYDGFDANQFTELKGVAQKHGSDGIAYFLYNPKLDAFPEEERKIVRALEGRMYSAYSWPLVPFWHPEMEFFFEKMLHHGRIPGPTVSHVEAVPADELRQRRQEAVERRPGLRVLGISSVAQIAETKGGIRSSFHLDDCYRYALSDHWWHNSGSVPFLPLSSFVVDWLMGCVRGSDNERIIRIAEGRSPDPDEDDDDTPGVAARHTIVITVRSTLHEMDVSFSQ